MSKASAAFKELADFCPWPPARGKGADYVFLILVGVLVLFGLLMVYSSSFIYAADRTGDGWLYIKKQSVFAVLGVGAFIAAMRIPSSFWSRSAYFILIFATVLLALTYVPGLSFKAGGAQRWLDLGLFKFQPGEIAKFAVVLFVARQLDKNFERIQSFSAGVLANFIVPLPIMILLLSQPDFGTAALIVSVTFLMMFFAGVSLKHLFASAAVFGAAAVTLIATSPYRLARISAYVDPWADPAGRGFQVLQSLVSFSNGEILGKGLGNGQGKLLFLPEAHNDFIFSVVGEELGLVGVIVIVSLYAYLLVRGIGIARKVLDQNGDRFGFLFACGMTCLIVWQAFTHFAVVLGLAPTKGLTLPFVSYGGTSLIIHLFCAGAILGVGRGDKKFSS